MLLCYFNIFIFTYLSKSCVVIIASIMIYKTMITIRGSQRPKKKVLLLRQVYFYDERVLMNLVSFPAQRMTLQESLPTTNYDSRKSIIKFLFFSLYEGCSFLFTVPIKTENNNYKMALYSLSLSIEILIYLQLYWRQN